MPVVAIDHITRHRNRLENGLSDTGQSVTIDRRDAVPITVTATVITVERKQERGIFGVLLGLSAHLHVAFRSGERPHSYFLSRLVGEQDWIIDEHFGPNSQPYYSHGFGARYLRVHAIAPELADLLDEHARRRGLAPTIGRDVPLTLTDDTSKNTTEDTVGEAGSGHG